MVRPEPSLPLSAIRALIQQWEIRVKKMKHGDAMGANATWDCIEELANLCLAPAAEEETR